MVFQPRKRIVIVDPHSTTLELVSYLLEREGYETFPFARVHSAVQFLRNHAVDLVLTESLVPLDHPRPLQGLESLMQAAGQAPVVLCSSHPRASSAIARAQIDEVIERPFDLEKFRGRIAGILAGSHAMREA